MHEVESVPSPSQRRRSERIPHSLPVIVRGVDLLGQPFEERTTVQACNLHGCRYPSKHHLSQNAWITLAMERNGQWQNVRARVAWTQRPRSIRDFFQVGVELETPGNFWDLESVPADWRLETVAGFADAGRQNEAATAAENFALIANRNEEDIVADIPFDSPLHAALASAASQQPGAGGSESEGPSLILSNLLEELRRQAREAVEAAAARVTDDIRASLEETHQRRLATSEEFFQAWKQEFARAQRAESEPPASSAELTASQEEFLNALKLKFEERFSEAHDLLEKLDQKAQSIRLEAEAIGQEAARAEQARLRAEELTASPLPPGAAEPASAGSASWNERLEVEMSAAQAQWNELLQSSLDGGIRRLASQLSDQSKEVLRDAERKLAERFEYLRQPLAETAAEAREILASIRGELEGEMGRARTSLSDIEHVAGRIKEYATQLEASSHDTLNELHRRLENILESQTAQLNHHAEHLLNGLSDRLNPEIEALGRELVERTTTEVEAKLTPRLERIPELIRELSAREMEAEEGLRLYRERLRHAADHNQRDVAAQLAAALVNLRRDAEAAGKESLAQWNEELRASGARASQAASEAIGQSSEWFQQEARSRLQVLVEQSTSTAESHLDELAAQSASKHAEDLGRKTLERVADAEKLIGDAASEAAARGRSQLDEAAQTAAASFGQVLRGISEQEMQQFRAAAHTAVQERSRDFGAFAQEALGKLSVSAEESLGTFRGRMTSEIDAAVAQGREGLAQELSSMLNGLANQREARQTEWAGSLDGLSQEATSKHEERLQTAGDAWIVSSVRRLNEHGQSTIESLMRVTDQALRDSCSKVFESLAEMMRDRTANAAGVGAFPPLGTREATENSAAQ